MRYDSLENAIRMLRVHNAQKTPKAIVELLQTTLNKNAMAVNNCLY